MRRRNQPAVELDYEYGEWIPAEAVMFNEDGSVSLLNAEGAAENPGDRPVIHIYGDPDSGYTYSLEMSYVNREGQHRHYSHHYHMSFSTFEKAEQHARDHIGKPHYGGEFGTVENWDRPLIDDHTEEGFEGAGIYGGGPPSWAEKMPNPRRRRA